MKNLGNLLGEIMQLKCDIRIGFSKFNEMRPGSSNASAATTSRLWGLASATVRGGR